MNGTSSSSNEARPDAEESQQFWRDILGKEVSHNENEEQLKELKQGTVEAQLEAGGHCNNSRNGDSKVKENPELEGTWL